MTPALFCILLAAVLPLVCAGLSKWRGFGVSHRDGGYDNRNPREWIARQDDFAKWAHAAQENSWEAFPFFAAAVIVSHLLGVTGWLPNALAVLFIALRSVYVWLYVSGRQKWRSRVWALAWLTNVVIFLLPLAR
ncbi:MAG: MAPEG family protein [Burkholderiales bacterium]|nr:MAPEG family protein [Burkholderiales bacterium]